LSEGAAHYAGKVKGEVKHRVMGAINGGCLGEAGVGSGADYDFEIGESVFKLFYNGSGCINFAYAYGVEPDTFSLGIFAGDFAESVGPAGPVAFVPDDPVYNHWTYGHSSQQIYKINYDSHRHCLLNNNGIIVFLNRS